MLINIKNSNAFTQKFLSWRSLAHLPTWDKHVIPIWNKLSLFTKQNKLWILASSRVSCSSCNKNSSTCVWSSGSEKEASLKKLNSNSIAMSSTKPFWLVGDRVRTSNNTYYYNWSFMRKNWNKMFGVVVPRRKMHVQFSHEDGTWAAWQPKDQKSRKNSQYIVVVVQMYVHVPPAGSSGLPLRTLTFGPPQDHQPEKKKRNMLATVTISQGFFSLANMESARLLFCECQQKAQDAIKIDLNLIGARSFVIVWQNSWAWTEWTGSFIVKRAIKSAELLCFSAKAWSTSFIRVRTRPNNVRF